MILALPLDVQVGFNVKIVALFASLLNTFLHFFNRKPKPREQLSVLSNNLQTEIFCSHFKTFTNDL